MFRPLGIWFLRSYDLAAHLGHLAFAEDLRYPGHLGHLASHLLTPYPQSHWAEHPLELTIAWRHILNL